MDPNSSVLYTGHAPHCSETNRVSTTWLTYMVDLGKIAYRSTRSVDTGDPITILLQCAGR